MFERDLQPFGLIKRSKEFFKTSEDIIESFRVRIKPTTENINELQQAETEEE